MPPAPLGDGLGEQPHRTPDPVDERRAERRHRQEELQALAQLRPLARGEPAHHVLDRAAQGLDRARLGRLLFERLEDQRVEPVPEDDVFLGREVAEERALRDLCGLGDLATGVFS